jgi:hypothetical protein
VADTGVSSNAEPLERSDSPLASSHVQSCDKFGSLQGSSGFSPLVSMSWRPCSSRISSINELEAMLEQDLFDAADPLHSLQNLSDQFKVDSRLNQLVCRRRQGKVCPAS